MTQMLGDPNELITAVDHKARGEAHKIIKDAQTKCDRIRDAAEKESRQRREAILQNARQKAEEHRRRRRVQSGREQTKAYLEAREELLQQVWKQAGDRLTQLKENRRAYSAVLEALLLETARAAGPGSWMVASDKKGHALLTPKKMQRLHRSISKKLNMKISFERSADPLEIQGGLVLIGGNGRHRLDASFDQRLQRAAEDLRREVLDLLVTP